MAAARLLAGLVLLVTHRLVFSAGLLAVLLPAPTARGLTIDDFSGADQSVTGSSTAGSEELAPVLGGVRFVLALPSGTGSFSTTAGGGAGSLSHTGDGSGTGFFQYDGVVDNNAPLLGGGLDIDLTQGGSLDRFRIEVLSVSRFSEVLRVTVADSDSIGEVSVTVFGPGSYKVLFSDYFQHVDFTDIRVLRLGTETQFGESTVVLGSFSATPEPSTALLFAGGLLALGLRARRRE